MCKGRYLKNVYEINEGLGGDNTLIIVPSNKYNVELRIGGPEGSTLGFVSSQMPTTFKVSEDNFLIYPAIRKFNPAYNEISSIIPYWKDGVAVGYAKFRAVNFDAANRTRTYDIADLLTDFD